MSVTNEAAATAFDTATISEQTIEGAFLLATLTLEFGVMRARAEGKDLSQAYKSVIKECVDTVAQYYEGKGIKVTKSEEIN